MNTDESNRALGAGVEIREVNDCRQKQEIVRTILEILPEWFGLDKSRQEYIDQSAGQILLCALDPKQPDCYRAAAGFVCLKETGKDTAEIAVMGVRREFHRMGIGRMLVECACRKARQKEYSLLQVKTVKMGLYPEYDQTNAFYQSLGFKEFEVFPDLWDEWNPCQVYVMAL